MKTADTIEQQEERKAARDNGHSSPENKPPAGQKSKQRDATRIAPWRFVPGQSGNPGGRPKHDLAAEIARAVFENNAEALYKAYTKAALKGNAYAFKELADRAFGRLKERVEIDRGPYAEKQWPQECLSYAEMVRRYVLAGMESLKNVSPADQTRLAHQFQASMTAGDTRLKS